MSGHVGQEPIDVGLSIPHIHMPPPAIDPVAHPWMSKIANASLMTVSRVVVPAVAIPLANMTTSDDNTPILPNIAISAALGAAIGGAAGLWFPAMEHQRIYRADAIRSGIVGGLFGAPAVSLAIMGTAKWFLKDLLPYGNGHVTPPGSDVPTSPFPGGLSVQIDDSHR